MAYGYEDTDMPLEMHGRCSSNTKADIASAARNIGREPRTTSAMENHLNQDEKQMTFLVETMRRVEEIADRLGGSIPTDESLAGAKVSPPYDGILGSLIRIHDDRQQVVLRISQACNRIDSLI